MSAWGGAAVRFVDLKPAVRGPAADTDLGEDRGSERGGSHDRIGLPAGARADERYGDDPFAQNRAHRRRGARSHSRGSTRRRLTPPKWRSHSPGQLVLSQKARVRTCRTLARCSLLLSPRSKRARQWLGTSAFVRVPAWAGLSQRRRCARAVPSAARSLRLALCSARLRHRNFRDQRIALVGSLRLVGAAQAPCRALASRA